MKQKAAGPDDDYDSPWKDAIERYFEAFMAFFFPKAHAQIDWQRGYEFLDKELSQVIRDAELGRRLVDKLVKVWLKDGRESWVLIHIEVQSQEEGDFSRRMFVYNYRLFDRYQRPVASLAVLGDERPAWRPDTFGYDLFGCQVKFNFPVVKLMEYRAHWPELEASDNPFATVVMAHLKAQETRQDAAGRKEWKLYLVRRLYERGYSREDILNLFHLIDWVMSLPKELDETFWQEVQEIEERKRMPYVTSVERIGIEKGIEQGIQQGIQQGAQRQLLRVLEHRFEFVPVAIMDDLEQLEAEQLEELMDVALTADSLPAFAEQLALLVEDEDNQEDE
jgi:hypothetical protein